MSEQDTATTTTTTTPSNPTQTVHITEEEQKLKDASDKYIQELRLTLQARVKKDDGTLGEPGALPQEQLAKHYKGEPLDAKQE